MSQPPKLLIPPPIPGGERAKSPRIAALSARFEQIDLANSPAANPRPPPAQGSPTFGSNPSSSALESPVHGGGSGMNRLRSPSSIGSNQKLLAVPAPPRLVGALPPSAASDAVAAATATTSLAAGSPVGAPIASAPGGPPSSAFVFSDRTGSVWFRSSSLFKNSWKRRTIRFSGDNLYVYRDGKDSEAAVVSILQCDVFAPVSPVVNGPREVSSGMLYSICIVSPFCDDVTFAVESEPERASWLLSFSRTTNPSLLRSLGPSFSFRGFLKRQLASKRMAYRCVAVTHGFFLFFVPRKSDLVLKYSIPLALVESSVHGSSLTISCPRDFCTGDEDGGDNVAKKEFLFDAECDVRAVRLGSVIESERANLLRRTEYTGALRNVQFKVSVLTQNRSVRVQVGTGEYTFPLASPDLSILIGALTSQAPDVRPNPPIVASYIGPIAHAVLDEFSGDLQHPAVLRFLQINSLARIVNSADFSYLDDVLAAFDKSNQKDLIEACSIALRESRAALLSRFIPLLSSQSLVRVLSMQLNSSDLNGILSAFKDITEPIVTALAINVARGNMQNVQAFLHRFPSIVSEKVGSVVLNSEDSRICASSIPVPCSLLHVAAWENHADLTALLVSKHPKSLTTFDGKGRTVLFSAVRNAQQDSVLVLLKTSHVRTEDLHLGSNPLLHYAVAFNCPKVVDFLAAKNINNMLTLKDANGLLPYDVGIHSGTTDCLRVLLQYSPLTRQLLTTLLSEDRFGVLIERVVENIEKFKNVAEAFEAILGIGRVEPLRKFISKFYRVPVLCGDVLFSVPQTAVISLLNTAVASQMEIEETLDFLSSYVDLDVVSAEGLTALHVALSKQYLGCVKLLLSRGACATICEPSYGCSALHTAVLLQNTDAISLLLSSEHCDPNQRTFEKMILNPADEDMLVSLGPVTDRPGKTPLNMSFSVRDYPTMSLLLERGAVPHFAGILHNCVEKGDLKAVELLVRYGANVRALASGGPKDKMSALNLAVEKHSAGSPIVRLLEASLASPCPFSDRGETVLHVACRSNSLQEIKIVMTDRTLLNRRDVSGLTPLHIACHRGEPRIVEFILQCGASVHQRTTGLLRTAMQIVCRTLSEKKGEAYSKAMECVDLLLKSGAKICFPLDHFGKSALHELPEVLLQKVPAHELTNPVDVKYLPKVLSALPGPSREAFLAKLKSTWDSNLDVILSNQPFWPYGIGSVVKESGRTIVPPSLPLFSSQARSRALTPKFRPYEIPLSELKLQKELGRGAFGVVYRGVWHGTDVAVKRLEKTQVSNIPEDVLFNSFESEVSLLADLRHPNVVLFMGASFTSDGIFFVTEFCHHGSLFDVLHDLKAFPDSLFTFPVRLRMAVDIARGMTYLHSQRPPVIHQDLKSMNVLVSDSLQCKVTDFGLSAEKSTYRPIASSGGTPYYCAPETLTQHLASEASDVYAFGVIMYELLTRDYPFRELGANFTIDTFKRKVCEENKRPNSSLPAPNSFKGEREWTTLMERCWHANTSLRPSFEETLGKLLELQSMIAPL
eukprot:ANDGO_01124.mRNA.1 hypothetical protein